MSGGPAPQEATPFQHPLVLSMAPAVAPPAPALCLSQGMWSPHPVRPTRLDCTFLRVFPRLRWLPHPRSHNRAPRPRLGFLPGKAVLPAGLPLRTQGQMVRGFTWTRSAQPCLRRRYHADHRKGTLAGVSVPSLRPSASGPSCPEKGRSDSIQATGWAVAQEDPTSEATVLAKEVLPRSSCCSH